MGLSSHTVTGDEQADGGSCHGGTGSYSDRHTYTGHIPVLLFLSAKMWAVGASEVVVLINHHLV